MGHRRVSDPGVARVIDRASQLDQERERRLRIAFLRSETMATMLLGCLALTLAIVMLISTLLGLYGIPTGSLSTPVTQLIKTTAFLQVPDSVALIDPGTGVTSYYIQRRVWLPSNDCVLISFVGLFSGLAGLLISLRRKKFSWLSSIGIALVLLTMLIVVASGEMMGL